MTNLEKLRRDRGLDQMELAKLTGVSQSTISRIERGSGVLLGTAQALAQALGCSVEELTRNNSPDAEDPIEVLHAVTDAERGAA